MELISGFSKLDIKQKKEWINSQIDSRHESNINENIYYELTENVIDLFKLPFSLAPNFLINGDVYCVPMVTEESSVVAAASKSAKFWSNNGGFHADVLSTVKKGNIHFFWSGEKNELINFFQDFKISIEDLTADICENMIKRGGGLKEVKLVDLTSQLDDYFKISVSFETCDAMGANFINSILEKIALEFSQYLNKKKKYSKSF